MEKYLLDFFDDVVSGKYGITTINKQKVMLFVEKANNEEIELVDDIYWDWTSVLCEPDDIDMELLEQIFLIVMKK